MTANGQRGERHTERQREENGRGWRVDREERGRLERVDAERAKWQGKGGGGGLIL